MHENTTPEEFAPRRTGKAPEKVESFTDKFIPYKNGQPCLLNMPLSPHDYLPCFDSAKELRTFFERAKVTFDDIKQITEGREFKVSIPYDIILITKLRFTESGTVKFVQLFRN